MRYESIKSIILFLLVIASGVLTWSLWTFKTNVDFNDGKYLHNIAIADPADVADIIKPTKILFHLEGAHFGTTRNLDINMIIDTISSWNYYDISPGRSYSDFKLRQLSSSDGRITIKYPDSIPFDLYKGVIHVETEDMSHAAFDQIVIDPKQEKEGASVFFINTEKNMVYETHVNPERITTLLNQIDRDSFDQYIPFELPEGKIVYIPEGEPEVEAPRYFAEFIDLEKFKKALFRDPNKVRRGISANGEQYADDTSLMDVDNANYRIYYVNPAREPGIDIEESENSLLKKSIDFINEHGGWTDDYRYEKTAEFQRKTVFRLFVNEYPVFNDQFTEIHQYWGDEEVYKYERPYFSLEVDLPNPRVVALPSAESALSHLLKDDTFKPQLLEDLAVGYRMSRDVENQKVVITLEPSWYYLYTGSWFQIDSKKVREGANSGLEPN